MLCPVAYATQWAKGGVTMKKRVLGFLVIALLSVNLAGCTVPPSAAQSGVTFAPDYDSVYQAIVSMRSSSNYLNGINGWVMADSSFSNFALPPVVTMVGTENLLAGSGSADYSKTNVQVEGIDEGDIVKTDGTHIYSLWKGKLSIFYADGANTRIVSETNVVDAQDTYPVTFWNESNTLQEHRYEYAQEMYICGNLVIIVTQAYSYSTPAGFSYWGSYQTSAACKLYIYDVSKPVAPELIYELGQDGSFLASRLMGNTLYLLSSHHVYDYVKGLPETFVPAVYSGASKSLVSADCIAIMPYVNSIGYVVVSAVDVLSGTVVANQALLGSGSLVYMSEQNIYIAGYEYKMEESAPYKEDIYTVVDYSSGTITNIIRLDISNGGVKYAAYGSVPGYLDSQFSMDEYKGYLRVVTTSNFNKYSLYTDEVRGFTNYRWDENESSNGLYVFDLSLDCIGVVDNLAPNERVYSVRFSGDIGYFVTFRTVDPLFAVDLSNPKKPVVLSALKIPGFSEYLHVYSDGLLFGLGYGADEKTGMRDTMKLSMFDTSNPANVTETHTLSINSNYSTALYNHKAILVDAEKDIIGFAADNEYLVYGYNAQTGFYLRTSIKLNDTWWNDSRGLYISGSFYVVSENGIAVIDMTTFNLVRMVSYGG